MPFSLTVDRPGDLKATLQKAKELVEESKGVFNGDENSGYIISKGVEGTYIVSANSIKITVNKKPKLYPELAVKEYIKGFFRT